MLKTKEPSVQTATAENDIALIHQFTRNELKPEDVYCFSVTLCDNEIDRDMEQISDEALHKLAELYVGKTGIFDHNWTAKGQVARIYRCEVVETGKRNSLGAPYRYLRGSAYMLRNDETRSMIEKIEAGILKEVSVGFAAKPVVCSVCGAEMRGWECQKHHQKGKVYDGKNCYGIITEPTDAFEFSLVAVPAQRAAGITKAFSNAWDAFTVLMESDLEPELLEKLSKRCHEALLSAEERKERQKLLAENEKILTRFNKQTLKG